LDTNRFRSITPRKFRLYFIFLPKFSKSSSGSNPLTRKAVSIICFNLPLNHVSIILALSPKDGSFFVSIIS
jgi:hypothetical protein